MCTSVKIFLLIISQSDGRISLFWPKWWEKCMLYTLLIWTLKLMVTKERICWIMLELTKFCLGSGFSNCGARTCLTSLTDTSIFAGHGNSSWIVIFVSTILAVTAKSIVFTINANSTTLQFTSKVIAPVSTIHIFIVITLGWMTKTVASF